MSTIVTTALTTSALVINHNDAPMATSLKVADVFRKMHKDVLKAIEALDCSEEFRERNFALSSYNIAENRRPYPMYLMTRDGFTFLAMGFTGARAAEFKEKYISEFNRMEAHIRQNQMVAIPNFNNPVEAARAWADQMEKRQALEAQNAAMLPKANKYDKYMSSDGTIDLTRAAKNLGFASAKALGQYLRVNLNWLFKTTKKVTPKAHVIEQGYMTCKLLVNDTTGYGAVHGRITPKGFGFLMEHFGIKEEEEAA